MTASPFAQAHAQLSPLGFVLLPALPATLDRPGAGKAPGHFSGGGWSGLPKWSQYAQTGVSSFLQGMWEKMEGANAGFLTGTSAGRDPEGNSLQLVVLDFDCRDPDDLAILLASAPSSPAEKVGRVGLSRLFRAPVDLASKSYDSAKGGGRLLDLLAAGRFCVSPPSRHPVSGLEYRWTQGPVPVSELPILTRSDIEQLEEALQLVGWEPQADKVRISAGPRVERVRGDYDDVWAEANGEGLARLAEWFPLLNLPGTGQSRAGVFSAVPVWRPSGSARPTEMRKSNLSASSGMGGTPAGIRDWGCTGPDANLTAIDLVQRALDLDAPDAMNWLRETLGLDDDDSNVVIDLSGMIAANADPEANLPEPLRGLGDAPQRKTAPVAIEIETGADLSKGGASATVSDVQHPATHALPSELPTHLLECPGLVGQISAWMDRTAQRPLPVANLLAALSVVGTAGGRIFAGPTESSLVLFGLALAKSGSGKAHPILAAEFLLRKAGLGRMVAPSSWMSGSALVQHLGRQPVCVSYADEVGEFFAKLNGAKASTHERAVSGVLRQLFGTNWGSYTTPGWAASNTAATTPSVIHAPAYSFIGFSVPEAVWDAMQGADITNGFLNRFILMPSADAGVERDDPESVFDIPESLVAQVQTISQTGGALAAATMHTDMATEPLVRVPWEDGPTGRAAALFKELRKHCRDHPQGEHLMKRTAEIAVRLATIRAIGINPSSPRVTLDDMDWGRNIALFSAERMIADAASFMSVSEWQAKAKFVLRCIVEAPGRRIGRAALCKKVNHRFPARDLDALIKGLMESGEVTDNSSRSGRRGPEALTYVAV